MEENNLEKIKLSKRYAPIRVLVVEDNPVDRELLKAQLDKIGFRNVQEAHHGAEGIFKLENAFKVGKPYHILIVDWKMPGMDGLNVIKRLKKDGTFGQIRVMMLTSVSDERRVIEALREGIDAFIMKPIEHEILQQKIEMIVSRIVL